MTSPGFARHALTSSSSVRYGESRPTTTMSGSSMSFAMGVVSASFADIAAIEPVGVFYSNGPGDPSASDAQVAVLREVLDARLPYFGICFGNQLFGHALGFGTYKLTYGHRGINQPVLDRTTRKV